MCELFSVALNFKNVLLQNVNDSIENKEVILCLRINGEEIESECQDSFFLIDGSYDIKNIFNVQCQANDMQSNDDFMFKVFGSVITVKLITANDESETFESEACISLLDLLQSLQSCGRDNKRESSITFKIQNSSITIRYDVEFENAPTIASRFLLEISNIHHHEILQDHFANICFHFPYNDNFRAVTLQKSLDSASKERVVYENFQQETGVQLFHEMVINQQNFLIELTTSESKKFAAFIDLDIFNYPGVNEMYFNVPLYEWDDNNILEMTQEKSNLSRRIESKKFSRKSKISSINDEHLTPELSESKINIEVRIKISKSLHSKITTDALMHELNLSFPFMYEKRVGDIFITACEKDLECTVRRLSAKMEALIDENSHLNDEEMIRELKKLIFKKNLCMKNEFKETVETIIGNTFNMRTKTKTNHEFKLMLIEVFESLSREITEIQSKRKKSQQKVRIDDESVKWQIEEHIEKGEKEKAKDLINHELNVNLDEIKLKQAANYFMKIKDYVAVEDVIRKLLKIDRCCSYAYYLLSYIFVEREEISAAILTLLILTRIEDRNLEYWMLLSNLYNKTHYTCGVKFCEKMIQSSRFFPNFSSTVSIKYPKLILTNVFSKVLDNQLNLSVPKFIEITKQRTSTSNFTSDDKFLEIIELSEENKFDEALESLKSIEITDENEINFRTFKGNLYYDNKMIWRAICEYEIVYELCLKHGENFLYLPAIRCGYWYLNEMENVAKAKKYFSYCSKTYSTFDSWMGLGKSHLFSMDHKMAEDCFIRANQIDIQSPESWLFLALINCKLQRCDIAIKCYQTAKTLGVSEADENFLCVEQFLDI